MQHKSSKGKDPTEEIIIPIRKNKTEELIQLKKEKSNKLKEIRQKPNEQWLLDFNEYFKFIEAKGHPPSQASKDKEEVRLFTWGFMQKRYKKRKTLSDIKAELLTKRFPRFFDDFKTVKAEKKWNERFLILEEYFLKNKQFPSSVSKDSTVASIGKWLIKQRAAFKNGELSNDKIAKFENLSHDFFTKKQKQNSL